MERVWSTSRRGFSVRSILTFVLTVFITALLWVTFGSHTSTHAADSPASWKGASILYNGHQYFAQGDVKDGDSIGLPQGSHYYLYTPDAATQDTATQTNTTAAPKTQKAFVIYFASGTDPPKEKTAALATYDYSASKVFSHQTDKQTITITPQGQESTYSSCTIQGIGWIICPITTFLADGMDNIFNIVKGFLVVQPANTTNTNNDLYVAWNIMRGIANVAFTIVFLIIIYSQLTNAGISNYGLKKLLPRLIIGAVLVNLSYLICAAALDISNILGYSLQDIFVNIRQSTFNISNDTWANSDGMGWSAITAFVLSGGAATIGILIATGGTIAGAVYLLIPILLGLILTILMVLLILAARQAIIIILIVIAPLAFVAYLLPNTEQWFKKWRELFMTMLIFFPAFSLAFGGSQLAGGLIIQNATSIIGVIFGMAVQIAPLVITPFLLKLSGGLLGRIAGIVNDPKKGLLDRTKAWTGDRAAEHRQRGLRDNNLKWYNGARKIARALDNNNRNVKNRTALYTSEADNRYNRTHRYEKLYEQTQGAETEKKRIEAVHERNYRTKVSTDSALLKREIDMRTTVDEASDAGERLNRVHEGIRAGLDISTTQNLAAFTIRSQDTTRNLALSAISIQTSKRMQQNQLSEALLKNTATIDGLKVREWAGITDAANGAESALTYAVNLKREAEGKLVAERTQLMKHFKLDGSNRQKLAMGNDVPNVADSSGYTYTFRAADEYAREAAIEMQLKTGSFDDIKAIIEDSGLGAFDYRTTISDAIPANGLPAKALFFGGRFINEVGLGNVKGPDSLTYWAAQSIVGGKIKAEDLANNDAGALAIYLDAARNGMQYIEPGQAAAFTENVRALKKTAALILDPSTDLDRHATQSAKEVLKDIENL